MMTPQSRAVEAMEIEGVEVSRLLVHEDDRGAFIELMRESSSQWKFRQSNLSRSAKGVLRGLHFHRQQADLWFLLEGRIQVGLADLREPDRVRTASLQMSAEIPETLLIPPGVAHGFLALTDCRLLYWVSTEFDGSDEHGIRWNDPVVQIPWEEEDPILSERDASAPFLTAQNLPGSN